MSLKENKWVRKVKNFTLNFTPKHWATYGVLCTFFLIFIFYIFDIGYSDILYVLALDSVFYLMTIISFGTIIGWSFIFSIIKKPSSFKQQLADHYIIFIVSILNHKNIPDRFIYFSTALGGAFGPKNHPDLAGFFSKVSCDNYFFPFYNFFFYFICCWVFFLLVHDILGLLVGF